MNSCSVDYQENIAKLYIELYIGCLKFKDRQNKMNTVNNTTNLNNVDCSFYLEQFKIHQAKIDKYKYKEILKNIYFKYTKIE